MNPFPLLSLTAALIAAGALPATDRIVDPSGAPGTYPSLRAAHAAAVPGDRILVLPGTYAGFQLSKAVSVIGLGGDPTAVVVGPVAFHPIHPHSGWHVTISGLSVRPSTPGQHAISGDELGTGILVLDDVIAAGGVHLGFFQAGGSLVMITNCRVTTTDPAAGKLDAAVSVTGPDVRVHVTRSELTGADGTLYPTHHPLAALTVDQGARLWLAQSVLHGGDGRVVQPGAPALLVGRASVPFLSGGAVLTGGRADVGYPGGAAVDSDGPVHLGAASLQGGRGDPDGPTFTGRGTLLRLDAREPDLRVTADGRTVGPMGLRAGSTVQWTLPAVGPPAAIVSATGVTHPTLFADLVLDPAATGIVVHGPMQWTVPPLPPGAAGTLWHSQAVVLDVGAATVRIGPAVTVGLDG